ncbi:MAG: aminoacyl-tRNA hydrolase [Chloroflexota bacterium]
MGLATAIRRAWRRNREDAQPAYLIVGLGNPGDRYEGSRHNVGFRCVDRLADRYGARLDGKECRARVGTCRRESRDLLLCKPQTYVNLSGEAVGCLVRRYRVSLDRVIVVCDDLDLPTGKVRVRASGGAAGHKGMKSIIQHLGSDKFPRVRVGIGRPSPGDWSTDTERDSIVEYVLDTFSRAEEHVIAPAIEEVIDAIDCVVREGVQPAMSRFN